MTIIQGDSWPVCVHDGLFELTGGVLTEDDCDQLQDDGKDLIRRTF